MAYNHRQERRWLYGWLDYKLHLLDVDYNLVSAYRHFGKKGLPWEE